MLERYHPTTCTISDLVVGNSYSFRVFSENLCGLSASAAVTKELAHIQKAGGSAPGPVMLAPRLLSAFSLVWQLPSLWASHGCCPVHARHRGNRKEMDVGIDLTNTSEQTHANKKRPWETVYLF